MCACVDACAVSEPTWTDYFHLNVLETKAKNHDCSEFPKAFLGVHLSNEFTWNHTADFSFFPTSVLGLDLEMEHVYFGISSSLLQWKISCLFPYLL